MHRLVSYYPQQLDNLNATPSNSGLFPQKPEVGVYNQLQWIGFSVDTPLLDPASPDFIGIPPKSAPNYATAPVVPDFFLPSLTSSYPGSRVVFFDFNNFVWGCSTQDPKFAFATPGWFVSSPSSSHASSPCPFPPLTPRLHRCSLEIYGYTHGTRLPTAKAVSFFFPKEGAQSMELIYAGLPTSFKAVNRVEFKVDADTPGPMLYLDNVQYTVYNVTDMGNGIGEVIHQQTTSGGTRSPRGGQAALQVEEEWQA